MFRFEKSDVLPCMLPLFRETLVLEEHLLDVTFPRISDIGSRERRRLDRIVGSRPAG